MPSTLYPPLQFILTTLGNEYAHLIGKQSEIHKGNKLAQKSQNSYSGLSDIPVLLPLYAILQEQRVT